MTNLIVQGGRALKGAITPSANKNAVLPILCGTLLTREPVILHRVPDITDVRKILAFFEKLGSRVDMNFDTGTLRVHHTGQLNREAATLPAADMRSFLMLVPGLMKLFGEVVLQDEIKGCTLGVREIDPHIEVFERFGAEVTTRGDASCSRIVI